MAWSLSYQMPEEPELLDLFFLASGRSLYLANAFESKCASLLGLMKFAYKYNPASDTLASFALTNKLRSTMLGSTISGLRAFPDFKSPDIECLDKGREARNYIAHEGGDVGSLEAPANHILERFRSLRQKVSELAEADNLVSRWLYYIEDPKNSRTIIEDEYPRWVDRWVFRRFDDFMKTYRPKEVFGTGTDRLIELMDKPIRHPDYTRQ